MQTEARNVRDDRNRSLEKLFNGLNTQTCSYNNVRFSSFRIALKVRALITKFKLSSIDYKIALFQLNQEGIAFGRQFALPIERARHIIQSLYHSLSPVHFTDISISDLTEGLCAVFTRILDDSRTKHHFDSDCFKLLLFSLMNMNLTLKYMYLYQMLCFPSSTITVPKARLLFTVLAKIAHCVDNHPDDVESCAETLVDGLLTKTDHKEIDKSSFLEFLNDRPAGLEWMHSLHLLLSCASVRHEAQCDVCGTYPIVGLRYRCLRCFDYDLCATCHLLGSFSKDHLPCHEVQQLVKQVTPVEDFKAFIEMLRRRLFRSRFFATKYKALAFHRESSGQSSPDNFKSRSLTEPMKLSENVRSLSRSQELRSNRIYRPLSRCHTLNKSVSSTEAATLNSCRPMANGEQFIEQSSCRSITVIPEDDTEFPRNYDNVPSLQEVVRSVERTSLYDRYVNISSSTVIRTHSHHYPTNTTTTRSTWRMFSRTDPLLLYQNVRNDDDTLVHDEETISWQGTGRNSGYALLPNSHSSNGLWRRLTQSQL